jgi:hypothetical protein
VPHEVYRLTVDLELSSSDAAGTAAGAGRAAERKCATPRKPGGKSGDFFGDIFALAGGTIDLIDFTGV